MFLPIRTMEYHATIASTNDRVRELLCGANKPKLPCLVIAKQQTAGRGRGDKRWWSAHGAILMSLGFEAHRDQLPTLSASTAWSVIDVLSRYLPQHNLEFHPPNDVYVEGKKICGILLESPTPQYAILGIGLNVNNRISDMSAEYNVDRPIASMIDLLDAETDMHQLVAELLDTLDSKGQAVNSTLIKESEKCAAK